MVRAYKFALDPTDAQIASLRSHCGAQRFAYNWGLYLVKANMEQRAAERTYGLEESELTPRVDSSAYGLRKRWNREKCTTAPWWSENSKEAYASGLANLAVALRNWKESIGGRRKGPSIRFPVFKRRTGLLSCKFTTGAIGLVDADRRHVKLPRIGLVRTHESTRKLARRLEAGRARIRSATISFRRGRWFVAFSVEVLAKRVPPKNTIRVIGIDMGIKRLATLSSTVRGVSDADGFVTVVQHLEEKQKKLRRFNRQAARRRGRSNKDESPSRRWTKTQAKCAKIHADIANARSDALNKVTTGITQRFDVIVIEDLYVAGMIRNRSLSRRIAGAGWGEFRRQITCKAPRCGAVVIVANRFYPSSKRCSRCGVEKAKLRLSERIFDCEHCGLTIDRDTNAARNLAGLAKDLSAQTSTSSCGATLNEPAGNPCESDIVGSGYGHGKPHAGNVA